MDMKIILIMLVLFLIYIAYAYFGRKCSGIMGRNIGEKHMKEQWGINDEKKY